MAKSFVDLIHFRASQLKVATHLAASVTPHSLISINRPKKSQITLVKSRQQIETSEKSTDFFLFRAVPLRAAPHSVALVASHSLTSINLSPEKSPKSLALSRQLTTTY